jgi:predicted RNase H-like HicB family nuclease
MTYAVIYERGPNEEGRQTWSAFVPDLPGCVSCCETRAECERMIREAIELHLEALREDGLPVSEPTCEAGMVEVQMLLNSGLPKQPLIDAVLQ